MNDLVVQILRFLHFVGLAMLLGGLMVQLRALHRQVTGTVIWGGVLQLLTGVAFFALLIADVDHLKLTVKAVLLLVVIALALAYRRKDFPAIPFGASILLTAVITGIAVFW